MFTWVCLIIFSNIVYKILSSFFLSKYMTFLLTFIIIPTNITHVVQIHIKRTCNYEHLILGGLSMKKISFLVILTLFLSAVIITSCSTIDIATNRSVNITKKMKKIAVLPFRIKGAGWGDEFADAISHNFFKTGKMSVVERDAIKKIIKEQKMGASGLVDSSKAVEIGKMLNADVIIFGRGSALKRYYRKRMPANLIDTFSLRAVNVETGALLITVRKESGREWNWKYRAKFCCLGVPFLTLFYDTKDVLEESSNYDVIARTIVKKILAKIEEIQMNQLIKASN